MGLVSESQELVEALVKQGVQTMLHVARSPDGVRGLYTTSAVPADTLMLTCPAHTTLTMPLTDSAYASPYLLREVLYHRRQQQLAQATPPTPPAAQQHTTSSNTHSSFPTDSAISPLVSSAAQPSCGTCGAFLWRPSMPPEFIHSLPKPGEFITGYSWPEEAIPLLACPDLEAVVHLLQWRAERVYRTGLLGGAVHAAEGGELTRGPMFPLTLADAELQANGLCPSCSKASHHLESMCTEAVRHEDEEQDNCSPDGVVRDDGGGLCLASLADVQWAASLVCSRTFQSSAPQTMVMVPLLDMVNHQEYNSNASVQSDSDSDSEDIVILSSEHEEAEQQRSVDHAPSHLTMTVKASQDRPEHAIPATEEKPTHQPPNQHQGVNALVSKLHNMCLPDELSVSVSNDKITAAQPDVEVRSTGVGGHDGQVSPHQWAPGFDRISVMRSKRALDKDEEVTFTYHHGMRDDEVLLYYGFMAWGAPPYLCAVDHHLCAPRMLAIHNAEYDLHDAWGALVLDPLNGPWRGERLTFQGTDKAVRAELQRLRALLHDHNRRCAKLDVPGAVPDKARAACHMAGTPWLVDLCAEFRKRRGQALNLEMKQLKDKVPDNDSVGSGRNQSGSRKWTTRHV